jgi:Zn-dependent peptidase ImmA (M78 family)
MDIRKQISVRLQTEMSRKCCTISRIASKAGLSNAIVEGYIKADREINFEELRPICEALKTTLMWLLSSNYKQSHLTFRALSDQNLAKVSQIENTFLILHSILPQPIVGSIPRLNIYDSNQGMIQAEINSIIQEIKKKHANVESVYSDLHLPLLPISSGEDGFDAFIMNAGKSSVVCINRDKPPARIHFSLLHELAHFFWHRDKSVPVDVSIEGSFGNDQLSEECIPEYVANKFAQQFLFSINEIQTIAPSWQNLPDAFNLVAERRTTPDVLAFAIFDYLKLTSKPVSFVVVRDFIKENIGAGWGADRTVIQYVENSGEELRNVIYKHRDLFSDSVWNEIKNAWELSID